VTLSALQRAVTATGTLGGIAAGSGIAAAVGASALLDGGNAFDAALAAALAETIALPPKCGLAGDLVALYVTPDDPGPMSIVSVGGAAAGLYEASAQRNWNVASTGGLSVGVPGAPAGYAEIARRGVRTLAAAAAPAIDLARRGIVWSPVLARLAAEADTKLMTHQPGGSIYRPAVGPWKVGERVAMPGLASLLEEFVRRGEQLFFDDLGTQIVDYVARHGGVLTADDLRSVEPEITSAPRVDLAGTSLWATPAPTYGAALQQAMVAHSDGAELSGAVSDAVGRLRGGQPAELTGGTSAIAAADRDGNVVVIVHSNSFPQFGSGLVVPGLDLILSNRAGRGFTFLADHPNAPHPGRRPLTTLHAWGMPAGTGWLFGATPGGEQQVPWNAQTIARLLSGDVPAEALTQPRWEFDAAGALRSEGAQIAEYGARSSHVLVQTGSETVAATADPRLDGRAVAV
jgi:gamma-glutamyltranspeptidase/glutathione hydrolase